MYRLTIELPDRDYTSDHETANRASNALGRILRARRLGSVPVVTEQPGVYAMGILTDGAYWDISRV